MSKVRPRPENGLLYFDFFYRGRRCREQTTLTDTPKNRADMERVLSKIDKEIAAGKFDYARYFPNSRVLALLDGAGGDQRRPLPRLEAAASKPKPTFSEFASLFYSEQGVGWRENTKDWMESLLRTHLLPVFAARPLDSILREEILGFRVKLFEKRDKQGRALSPKTINVVMRVLKAIMTEASTRHGFVNPFTGIKRLKVPRKDIHPFSLGEVQQLIQTVRKDYRSFLVVAFFTGMRPAEQFGLKWEYVDFQKREIRVRETLSKGRTEYTKTDGSQREIAMSAPVFSALQEQFAITGKRSDYVFCLNNGSPLNDRNFSLRVWHPLLRHLGLKRRVPYQMRHTAATLWLGAGENPEWIANQLGHSTTEMLFRVYSRYVPNLTRRDGSAMDRLLSDAMNSTIPPIQSKSIDPTPGAKP